MKTISIEEQFYRRQQIVAFIMIAAAAGLLLLSLFGSEGKRIDSFDAKGRSVSVTSINVPHGAVNVNTAGVDELAVLNGIGPSLAEALISEREENGIFYYPEDLLATKGIGDKKLQKIRDNISFQ